MNNDVEKQTYLEPAKSIIDLIGGVAETATAADTVLTTVQRWRLPKEKGGTNGFIPVQNHDKIISHARNVMGIELPPAAFLDVNAIPQKPTPQNGAAA